MVSYRTGDILIIMKAKIFAIVMMIISATYLRAYAKTHDFTGLPLTVDGWTDFTTMVNGSSYSEGKIIYVSTSGNDSSGGVYAVNDALIGADPFNPSGAILPHATLAAAYAKLRSGYPDIILLKRGDVWNAGFVEWKKSGRSKTAPMIIGAYGPLSSDRPEITTFTTRYGPDHPADNFSFTAITSIKMSGGLSRQINGDSFLIEDCLFPKGPGNGVVIQGYGLTNVTLRRSVIEGRYSATTAHVQGLYSSSTNNFLVEENVFDHNGWAEDKGDYGLATSYNHNTYFDVSVTNPVMRYNISTRASSKGFQAGGGGLIEGNLSVRDPIGIEPSRAESYKPDGFASIIRRNVVLDGWDSKTTGRTAWGIRLNNVSQSLVESNIIANVDPSSAGRAAIYFDSEVKSGVTLRVRNVTVKNNIIHNWGPIYFGFEYPVLENALLSGNSIHDEINTA